VGATPELLIRRRGASVESLVLAGTARRAAVEADDAAVGAELLSSAKDNREHEFAVDSVALVLAGVCDDLTVDDGPFLLKLANVQHLATRVRGRLAEPLSALELAGRLHPTAAVCGTPRAEAEGLIRRLEGMERGRYAGPVGWVDAAGDGEFGIALRCAEVNGARARLFAGNGIVADSRPEAELEETRLKLRAMQSALGDS
jgi:menaquinone-specific isochorismate synthase